MTYPTPMEQKGILYQIRQKYGVAADTDSYKLTHPGQYLKGAIAMESYVESRGGLFDELMFIGLQPIIKEYFLEKLTHEQVDNMLAFEKVHFNGNTTKELEIALRAVVDDYEGYIPIYIKAPKEGSIIPVKNVLMVIGTSVPDSRIFALVSYFETKLLRVWNVINVATTSYHIRKLILSFLQETSDNPEEVIKFSLHDFGSRGTTAMEQAAFSGIGHLISFLGTDTTIAIMAAEFAYNEPMAGHSIPASEHSSTCSHGPNGEYGFVENMFDMYAKPGALFATVIDSYDALRFIREIAPQFKQRLIDSGAKWIFRPDSGDPIEMPIKVVQELDKIFGHTTNDKGYKVLNNVGAIQGDGIVLNDISLILKKLTDLKYCASNISFGMGGGLMQKNDRDTQKMSMKCSAICDAEGNWHEVFKDPAVYDADWNRKEEKSFKISKKGRLDLTIKDGEYKTVPYVENNSLSVMEMVYINGRLMRDMTLTQVREQAGTF